MIPLFRLLTEKVDQVERALSFVRVRLQDSASLIQCSLIDALIATQVNSLQTLGLFDSRKNAHDNAFIKICRCQIQVNELRVTPQEIDDLGPGMVLLFNANTAVHYVVVRDVQVHQLFVNLDILHQAIHFSWLNTVSRQVKILKQP